MLSTIPHCYCFSLLLIVVVTLLFMVVMMLKQLPLLNGDVGLLIVKDTLLFQLVILYLGEVSVCLLVVLE